MPDLSVTSDNICTHFVSLSIILFHSHFHLPMRHQKLGVHIKSLGERCDPHTDD
jgi:hypothetical protein